MFDSVLFVSLGPGDSELITLKGLKVLQQADIIYCPATTSGPDNISSRAMNMLLDLDIDRNKIELMSIPMNKDRSKALECYKNVSEKIAEHFIHGIKIAVVAEGDTGFYSSIHYISDNLNAADIPVKRIAGIPAFIACGSLANLHIVKQEERLIVIPGITTFENLRKEIEEGKTVVIMKPSQCQDVIKDALLEMEDATFHYFENVGIFEKEFYTKDKEEIKNRKFPYFSLLIIQVS